jgi:pantoate--beta-alanine ligase
VNIIGMPIVREVDGLAMSSRNVYLSPEQRQRALSLSKALNTVRQAYAAGERATQGLRQKALAIIEPNVGSIDYLDFRDRDSLVEQETADERTLCAIAVKIGTTRLIDNTVLGED